MRTLRKDFQILKIARSGCCNLEFPSCLLLKTLAELAAYSPDEADGFVEEFRTHSGANKLSTGFDSYDKEAWDNLSYKEKADIRRIKLAIFQDHLVSKGHLRIED